MKRVIVNLESNAREQLIDVTETLINIASDNTNYYLMALFAKGATAAVMIQENWDPNIQVDILSCLSQLVPRGQWLHDKVDGNADSHIKAGIVGPSETLPISDGKLELGTWQNVFFCDFDGPRQNRELIVTLI